MSVFVHRIATAVPPTAYSQELILHRFLDLFANSRRAKTLLERIYSASGIVRRHSVVTDLTERPSRRLYFQSDDSVTSPTTADRNAISVGEARSLALQVARALVNDDEGLTRRDVTHVVTVSCTGLAAPGLDFVLVRTLGLPASTRRYHIGFMGCFAAFQALQLAHAFCSADESAVVLVVCVELCTLHLQIDTRPDNLVAASLFADGAAGALVSARAPGEGRPIYRLDSFASNLLPSGESDMSWTVGDHGFEMLLSKYVPSMLEAHLDAAVRPLLVASGMRLEDVHEWAIHPGGRAVLDKVEQAFGLEQEQMEASRYVLANYGNMSSPSVLFVLHRLLERPSRAAERRTLAMAFGPGLTVESAMLTRMGEGNR